MPKKKTTKKKATKKKVGRRSKLNAKTKNKICEALRLGNYAEVSARYAGI